MTAYGLRLIFWHFVSSLVDEDIRPVTLLMNDTGEITSIVVPWSGRFASEALDATESCVLQARVGSIYPRDIEFNNHLPVW